MVCSLTIRKKEYEQGETELKKVLEEAEALRKKAEGLIDKDTKFFNEVMAAYKIPKDNPLRPKMVQDALKNATSAPLEIAEIGVRILKLSKVAAFKGSVNSVSDAGVAALAAYAGVRGAVMNARINLRSMRDDFYKGEMLSRVKRMEEDAKGLFEEVDSIISFKLGN